MRRRDPRPRACRGPGTARRRDAAAARGRTRSSRRGSEGARRGRRRGTIPPPRPRRAHPRPRAAGRAARGRAPRGAPRGGAAGSAPRRAPSSAAPSRRTGSDRRASARRRMRRGALRAWMWSPGPCSSAGIAPRGVIVLSGRRPPNRAGSRAPQPRSTTPRGTPGALMSRYRGTRDGWVTASCRDRDAPASRSSESARWIDVRARREVRRTRASCRRAPRPPGVARHRTSCPQLKRRCVSSSPSLASVSIASAARATIASTSSSGAKGERT